MIKVQIIGRVGKKPEIRNTKAGRPVANFNIAVSAGKDANGEYISKWYPITCWDGRAELAEKIVEKGDLILVEGSPEISTWTDKNNELHTELQVHAKYLQLLARSKRGEGKEVSPLTSEQVELPADSDFSDLPF
jgi:single-strand DNA-binding protein